MFSEELKILDKNTITYMIDEMQNRLDTIKTELDSAKTELDTTKTELSSAKTKLDSLSDENAHLRKLLEAKNIKI